MELLSDEELVARARAAGGPEREKILNQLFERHHTRVAAWCYRIAGNTDEAADLAQEVFLKALQNIDSFRGQSKFTTWLYTIARNRCMDALKARATAPILAGDTVLEQTEDQRAGGQFADMERREAEQIVRQLMRESLDEMEAKVMTLHYVHELPLDAVTRLLALTNASGAKAYIVSARRKLAAAFGQRTGREQQKKGGGHAGSQAR